MVVSRAFGKQDLGKVNGIVVGFQLLGGAWERCFRRGVRRVSVVCAVGSSASCRRWSWGPASWARRPGRIAGA
ncbi:MAG: hypothetical protein ACLT98_08675 [Eggerthellaceae bacterium]